MTTYRVPLSDKITDGTFKSYVELVEKLRQGEQLNTGELKLTRDVSCKELSEFWRLPELPKYQAGQLSFSTTLKSDYCYRAMRTLLQAMLTTNKSESAHYQQLITAIGEGRGLTIRRSKLDSRYVSRRTDDETDTIVTQIKAGLTSGLAAIVGEYHANQIVMKIGVRDNGRAWRLIYTEVSNDIHLYINSLAPMPRLQVDSYRLTAETLNSNEKVKYVFNGQLYCAPIHVWVSQLTIYQLLDTLSRNKQIGGIKCNESIQGVMIAVTTVGVKPLMKQVEQRLGWDEHMHYASNTQIKELLEQQRRTKRSRITHER